MPMSHYRYPITICMEKTDQPTAIKFTFRNNTDKDLSVLKWYTPLEGKMKAPFLTITDNQLEQKLPYKGILAKRGLLKQNDFVVIPPKSNSNPIIIDLTTAYTFRQGEYTIKYKGPIEYIVGKVEPISENEIPNHIQGQETKKACHTTIIEVQHRRQYKKPKRTYYDVEKFHNYNKDQLATITQLLDELKDPRNGYQRVIKAVSRNSLYQKWFGEYKQRQADRVKEVYQACLDGIRFNANICYVFNCDGSEIAYADDDEDTIEIGFTRHYDEAPEREGNNSKLQTLVHELSHAFGHTKDILGGYGVKNCLQMAKERPKKAVKNADSYGYFYCDVILGGIE